MSEQFTDLDLKPNELRFIRKYIETGSATEAAKAYGSKSTNLAVRGSQILKRLNQPLNLLMAECGLTSLEILRTVKLGLLAEDTHYRGDDGEASAREFKTPNWAARARFADMAIRLTGGYPKSQMDLPFEIKDGKMVITAEFATHTEPGLEAGA